jgi:hypothetical protein
MCEMTQGENRLTEAMRRLTEMAPQGASAALGDALKDEFRRHHARRRRIQAARFSLIAASVAAGVVLSVVLLKPHASRTAARHDLPQTPPPSEPVSAGPIKGAVSPSTVAKVHAPTKPRKNPAAEADRFVALPTFDPAIPIDRLEMVRLDLPGRALQLVGFPVSEEFAERRVLADVLLAQDGTPYALRLVRRSETKEQWQ